MCNVFAPVFCCNFTNKGSREALLCTWPTAKPINKNVINHCHLSILHLRNCLFSLLLLETQRRLINFVWRTDAKFSKVKCFFQRENVLFKYRLQPQLRVYLWEQNHACICGWSLKRLCQMEFEYTQGVISVGLFL